MVLVLVVQLFPVVVDADEEVVGVGVAGIEVDDQGGGTGEENSLVGSVEVGEDHDDAEEELEDGEGNEEIGFG